MPSPRIDQLGFSSSTDLVKVVHLPGCLDPNCLLPSCINIKMQKSHLQTCTKSPGSCDICRQLKSIDEKGALSNNPYELARNPPSNPVNRRRTPTMEPINSKDEGDEEITIIEMVTNIPRDNPEKKLQKSTKKTMIADTAYNNLKNQQQASYSSVIPHDKTAVRYSFSNQSQMRPDAFQFTYCNSLSTCNQVVQPPLEVLCNALQALNTFIRLASSSQLELQVIPLLEQALADMKVTALNRLDLEGGISPTTLPSRNSSVVMECCDTDARIPDNQWLRVQPPPLPPAPAPAPPLPPMFPSSPPASTSPVSSSGTLVTAWESSSSPAESSSALHSNGEEPAYGDAENDEYEIDLHDIVLLDFVDELLG